MKTRNLFAVGVVAIALLGSLPNGGARAAEPMESSRVVLDWDQFKQLSGFEIEAAKEGQFVVPWKEVKDLFDLEIAGMDNAELKLPWQEFKRLLEWSVRQQGEEEVGDAPVPFLIASTEFISAELADDGALFEAKFKIDVLQEKGWKSIPILPGSVAVQDATLPQGVHLQLQGNHYALLTKEAGEIEVSVRFAVLVSESGGSRSLRFDKMPSGTALLDLTLPDANTDVQVEGARVQQEQAAGGKKRVVAALPAGNVVSLSWQKAVPEAEKVPAKLYTESRTLLSLADGLIVGRAQFTFSILHSGVRQLALTIPEGASVLDVTCPSLREWRLENGVLQVRLDREVLGTHLVDVLFEQAVDNTADMLELPLVRANDVVREKGYLGLVALASVELEPGDVEGAIRLDPKELPAELNGMTSQPILQGYRYVVDKVKVTTLVNRHARVGTLSTLIDKAHYTVMQTIDGRRIVRATYQLRSNQGQFLRLKLPEDAEIWHAAVSGRPVSPSKDLQERLLLPLARSGGGLKIVDLVYVEEGVSPDAKGRGKAVVSLPEMADPVTHLMVELYVPEQGRYEEFEGTLRQVDQFRRIGGGPALQHANAAAGLQVMVQQDYQQQAEMVTQGGGQAVDVQLPVTGKVYRFEKILVLDGQPWFSYEFRRLK